MLFLISWAGSIVTWFILSVWVGWLAMAFEREGANLVITGHCNRDAIEAVAVEFGLFGIMANPVTPGVSIRRGIRICALPLAIGSRIFRCGALGTWMRSRRPVPISRGLSLLRADDELREWDTALAVRRGDMEVADLALVGRRGAERDRPVRGVGPGCPMPRPGGSWLVAILILLSRLGSGCPVCLIPSGARVDRYQTLLPRAAASFACSVAQSPANPAHTVGSSAVRH